MCISAYMNKYIIAGGSILYKRNMSNYKYINAHKYTYKHTHIYIKIHNKIFKYTHINKHIYVSLPAASRRELHNGSREM